MADGRVDGYGGLQEALAGVAAPLHRVPASSLTDSLWKMTGPRTAPCHSAHGWPNDNPFVHGMSYLAVIIRAGFGNGMRA